MKKILSLLLIFCFFTSNVLGSVPLSDLAIPERFAMLSRQINPLDLSSEIGKVIQQREGKDPLIIHIQDAHAHYEAQIQIKRILEELTEKHAVHLIGLEGTSSALQPELYRFFPSKQANAAVADFLVKKGELTGAEFFAITHENPKLQWMGLEDGNLYKEALAKFQTVLKKSDASKPFFEKLETELGALKTGLLSSALKKFDSRNHAFHENKISFFQYGRYLQKLASRFLKRDLSRPEEQREFPALVRIAMLGNMESRFAKSSDRVREQREKLIEKLNTLLESPRLQGHQEGLKKEIRFLTGAIQSLEKSGETSQVSPRHLFESLYGISKKYGIDLNLFPDFKEWAGFLILRSEVEASAVFREISVLEKKIYDVLIHSQQERELIALGQDLDLLQKFLRLEMSREEYESFQSRQGELMPAVLAERLNKLRRDKSGPKNQRTHASMMQIPEALIPDLTASLKDAQSFYELARKREIAFVEKLLRAAQEKKQKRVILISGGFHSAGIQKILEERGIAHVTLAPRMHEENDSRKLYQQVILNEKTFLENELETPGSGDASSRTATGQHIVAHLKTVDPVLYAKENPSDPLRPSVVAWGALSQGVGPFLGENLNRDPVSAIHDVARQLTTTHPFFRGGRIEFSRSGTGERTPYVLRHSAPRSLWGRGIRSFDTFLSPADFSPIRIEVGALAAPKSEPTEISGASLGNEARQVNILVLDEQGYSRTNTVQTLEVLAANGEIRENTKVESAVNVKDALGVLEKRAAHRDQGEEGAFDVILVDFQFGLSGNSGNELTFLHQVFEPGNEHVRNFSGKIIVTTSDVARTREVFEAYPSDSEIRKRYDRQDILILEKDMDLIAVAINAFVQSSSQIGGPQNAVSEAGTSARGASLGKSAPKHQAQELKKDIYRGFLAALAIAKKKVMRPSDYPLSVLQPRQLRDLIGLGTVEDVEEGQLLAREAEQDDHSLYLLLPEGAQFKITRKDKTGREDIHINWMKRTGDFFGEMAALYSGPRTMTVKAIRAGKVLKIQQKDLKGFVAKNTRFAAALDQLAKSRDLNMDKIVRSARTVRQVHTANRVIEITGRKEGALLSPEDIDLLVNLLSSRNLRGNLLSKVKENNRVIVFEIEGVGDKESVGHKDLNSVLGYSLNDQIIDIRRQVIRELMEKEGLVDSQGKVGEELYGTYKSSVFVLRKGIPKSALEEKLERVRALLVERIDRAILEFAEGSDPVARKLLEYGIIKHSDRENREKFVTLKDYAVRFGVSTLAGSAVNDDLVADMEAHHAITIGRLRGGKGAFYDETGYARVIRRISELNARLANTPMMHDRTLTPFAAEFLRNHVAYEEVRLKLNVPEEVYRDAQEYFNFLHIQDYIPEWELDPRTALKTARAINFITDELKKLKKQDAAVIHAPVKPLLDFSRTYLLQDRKNPALRSWIDFHSRAPPKQGRKLVYITFDVQALGLANIASFEKELARIARALAQGKKTDVRRIAGKAAFEVTQELRRKENLIYELIQKSRKESDADNIPTLIGGDEFTVVVSEDDFVPGGLEIFLKEAKQLTQTRVIATKAVARRRAHYRRMHLPAEDLAHGESMYALDEGTALAKKLEDEGIFDAIVVQDEKEKWTVQFELPDKTTISFKADELMEQKDLYDYVQSHRLAAYRAGDIKRVFANPKLLSLIDDSLRREGKAILSRGKARIRRELRDKLHHEFEKVLSYQPGSVDSKISVDYENIAQIGYILYVPLIIDGFELYIRYFLSDSDPKDGARGTLFLRHQNSSVEPTAGPKKESSLIAQLLSPSEFVRATLYRSVYGEFFRERSLPYLYSTRRGEHVYFAMGALNSVNKLNKVVGVTIMNSSLSEEHLAIRHLLDNIEAEYHLRDRIRLLFKGDTFLIAFPPTQLSIDDMVTIMERLRDKIKARFDGKYGVAALEDFENKVIGKLKPEERWKILREIENVGVILDKRSRQIRTADGRSHSRRLVRFKLSHPNDPEKSLQELTAKLNKILKSFELRDTIQDTYAWLQDGSTFNGGYFPSLTASMVLVDAENVLREIEPGRTLRSVAPDPKEFVVGLFDHILRKLRDALPVAKQTRDATLFEPGQMPPLYSEEDLTREVIKAMHATMEARLLAHSRLAEVSEGERHRHGSRFHAIEFFRRNVISAIEQGQKGKLIQIVPTYNEGMDLVDINAQAGMAVGDLTIRTLGLSLVTAVEKLKPNWSVSFSLFMDRPRLFILDSKGELPSNEEIGDLLDKLQEDFNRSPTHDIARISIQGLRAYILETNEKTRKDIDPPVVFEKLEALNALGGEDVPPQYQHRTDAGNTITNYSSKLEAKIAQHEEALALKNARELEKLRGQSLGDNLASQVWERIKQELETHDPQVASKREGYLPRLYHALEDALTGPIGIQKKIETGEIHPEVFLKTYLYRDRQDDLEQVKLDRPLRVGFLPIAGSPINWGHILIAFIAMERLNLDTVVFRVQGEIKYKQVPKSDQVPENERHQLTEEVLKDFFPLFRYTDVGLKDDHQGEEAIFEFARDLVPHEDIDFYYIMGSETTKRVISHRDLLYSKLKEYGLPEKHHLEWVLMQRGEYGRTLEQDEAEKLMVSGAEKAELEHPMPVHVLRGRNVDLNIASTYYREGGDESTVPRKVHEFGVAHQYWGNRLRPDGSFMPREEAFRLDLQPVASKVSEVIDARMREKNNDDDLSIFMFDGPSGGGKTTVVEEVQRALEGQGYEVATLGLDMFLKFHPERKAIEEFVTGEKEDPTGKIQAGIYLDEASFFRRHSIRRLFRDILTFRRKRSLRKQEFVVQQPYIRRPAIEETKPAPDTYSFTLEKGSKKVLLIDGKYALYDAPDGFYDQAFRIDDNPGRNIALFQKRARRMRPDDEPRKIIFYDRALQPSYERYVRETARGVDYIIDLTREDFKLVTVEKAQSLGQTKLTGFEPKMPIRYFLEAFGIDSERAVIEPTGYFDGKNLQDFGRETLARGTPKLGTSRSERSVEIKGFRPLDPDGLRFGRVEVAHNLDTLESAASVFLTKFSQAQAPAYSSLIKARNLEVLSHLYLLTHKQRPAALVWALPGDKLLFYGLLYRSLQDQSALFRMDVNDSGKLPFEIQEDGAGLLKSLKKFLMSYHQVQADFIIDVTDDPGAEDMDTMTEIRQFPQAPQRGLAFPSVYGPWEKPTQILVQNLKQLPIDFSRLHLVEIGSGAGTITATLAALGARVTAYDLTWLKVMNTLAWADLAGVKNQVTVMKARSILELPDADGYVWNVPNLGKHAPQLQASDVLTLKPSKDFNVTIHPDDFRQVMQDLRDKVLKSSKPDAFLILRVPNDPLFKEILTETGWRGLDQPVGVNNRNIPEPASNTYLLRQRAASLGTDKETELMEVMNQKRIPLETQQKIAGRMLSIASEYDGASIDLLKEFAQAHFSRQAFQRIWRGKLYSPQTVLVVSLSALGILGWLAYWLYNLMENLTFSEEGLTLPMWKIVLAWTPAVMEVLLTITYVHWAALREFSSRWRMASSDLSFEKLDFKYGLEEFLTSRGAKVRPPATASSHESEGGDQAESLGEAPVNPFLRDVRGQVEEAGRLLGVDAEEVNRFLVPENIYAKRVKTKYELSNGWHGNFFITRVRHRRPAGPDGQPQRSQGGLRIILPDMMGPDFYQAVRNIPLEGDDAKDLDTLNQFVERWIVEEATALAVGMSFKNKVAGLPLGGGKGAIFLGEWRKIKFGLDVPGRWTLASINGGKFDRKDIAILMRDTGRAFAEDHVTDEKIDGAAPDVNPFKHLVSTSALMAWLVDETLEYLTEHPQDELWKSEPDLFVELTHAANDLIGTPYLDTAFSYTQRTGHALPVISRYTGKKVGQGGSLYRDKSTGEGSVMAAEALVRKLDPEKKTSERPLEGMSVAIQGFGNAAIFAAYRALRQGAKVVALSDSRGAIVKAAGFSEADIGKLQRLKEEGTAQKMSLLDAIGDGNDDFRVSDAKVLGKGAEGNRKLLELDVDVLIPAALEGQITKDNASRVQARIVSEAANGATTKEAFQILFTREDRTYVIPFILASAGGVAISSKEKEQNWTNQYLSEADLRTWLERQMQEAVEAVWAEHEKRRVDLGTAAFLVGFQRLVPNLTRASSLGPSVSHLEELLLTVQGDMEEINHFIAPNAEAIWTSTEISYETRINFVEAFKRLFFLMDLYRNNLNRFIYQDPREDSEWQVIRFALEKMERHFEILGEEVKGKGFDSFDRGYLKTKIDGASQAVRSVLQIIQQENIPPVEEERTPRLLANLNQSFLVQETTKSLSRITVPNSNYLRAYKDGYEIQQGSDSVLYHQVQSILRTVETLDRKIFIPEEKFESDVYFAGEMPPGLDEEITDPILTGLVLSLLNLRGAENVLEIGTGRGYQAAVLGRLLPRGHLHTYEKEERLVKQAIGNLKAFGIENVTFHHGDGFAGAAELGRRAGKFDVIVLGGAVHADTIESMKGLLNVSGRLVAGVIRDPADPHPQKQDLRLYIKKSEKEWVAITVEENVDYFVPFSKGASMGAPMLESVRTEDQAQTRAASLGKTSQEKDRELAIKALFGKVYPTKEDLETLNRFNKTGSSQYESIHPVFRSEEHPDALYDGGLGRFGDILRWLEDHHFIHVKNIKIVSRSELLAENSLTFSVRDKEIYVYFEDSETLVVTSALWKEIGDRSWEEFTKEKDGEAEYDVIQHRREKDKDDERINLYADHTTDFILMAWSAFLGEFLEDVEEELRSQSHRIFTNSLNREMSRMEIFLTVDTLRRKIPFELSDETLRSFAYLLEPHAWSGRRMRVFLPDRLTSITFHQIKQFYGMEADEGRIKSVIGSQDFRKHWQVKTQKSYQSTTMEGDSVPPGVIEKAMDVIRNPDVKQKLAYELSHFDTLYPGERWRIRRLVRFRMGGQTMLANEGSFLVLDYPLPSSGKKPKLYLLPSDSDKVVPELDYETEMPSYELEIEGGIGGPKSLAGDFRVVVEGNPIPLRDFLEKHMPLKLVNNQRMFSDLFILENGAEIVRNKVTEQLGFYSRGNEKILEIDFAAGIIHMAAIGRISKRSGQRKEAVLVAPGHFGFDPEFAPEDNPDNEFLLKYHFHPTLYPPLISSGDVSTHIKEFFGGHRERALSPELIINFNREGRIYLPRPHVNWRRAFNTLSNLASSQEGEGSFRGGRDPEHSYQRQLEFERTVSRYFDIISVKFAEDGSIVEWERVAKPQSFAADQGASLGKKIASDVFRDVLREEQDVDAASISNAAAGDVLESSHRSWRLSPPVQLLPFRQWSRSSLIAPLWPGVTSTQEEKVPPKLLLERSLWSAETWRRNPMPNQPQQRTLPYPLRFWQGIHGDDLLMGQTLASPYEGIDHSRYINNSQYLIDLFTNEPISIDDASVAGKGPAAASLGTKGEALVRAEVAEILGQERRDLEEVTGTIEIFAGKMVGLERDAKVLDYLLGIYAPLSVGVETTHREGRLAILMTTSDYLSVDSIREHLKVNPKAMVVVVVQGGEKEAAIYQQQLEQQLLAGAKNVLTLPTVPGQAGKVLSELSSGKRKDLLNKAREFYPEWDFNPSSLARHTVFFGSQKDLLKIASSQATKLVSPETADLEGYHVSKSEFNLYGNTLAFLIALRGGFDLIKKEIPDAADGLVAMRGVNEFSFNIAKLSGLIQQLTVKFQEYLTVSQAA